MAHLDKLAPKNAIRILLGNKCDKQDMREVTFEEGSELAAKYNVNFLETSAKSSQGVAEAFQILANDINNTVDFTEASTSASGKSIYKEIVKEKQFQQRD
eukprot:TRINITY_DN72033_c0_g1_i1.p4 TRINITY_DN72033_c0_g1~~TRINITY_DN72033_c0_g1_i1.p4  ORF type:complete len:100 (+),score=13.71 TRINITY_DN72033_c0_g1_i1:498-797(+)